MEQSKVKFMTMGLRFHQAEVTQPKLTQREREVATAFIKYHQQKQVARALGISQGAVAFHATTLRIKMGVSRTLIAAFLAQQKDLLQ